MQGDGARWPEGEDAWAYCARSASVWVRAGRPARTDAHARVRLEYAPSARALGDPLMTSGLPRLVARAQAAKQQLNKVAFEVRGGREGGGGGMQPCHQVRLPV